MRIFCAEMMRGKGLARAFLYEELRAYKDAIAFPAVDIACGKDPGYWRILGLTGSYRGSLMAIDRDVAAYPDIVHDISIGNVPFPDGSFKTAFLMNCLYAFPDPLYAMREASRLLARGGRLFATFPLVFPYTPEPHDFRRFTEERVRQLCLETSFRIIRFIPFGGRWSSATYLVGPFFRPYALFGVPLGLAARFLDTTTEFFFPRFPKAPIGYLVVAERL